MPIAYTTRLQRSSIIDAGNDCILGVTLFNFMERNLHDYLRNKALIKANHLLQIMQRVEIKEYQKGDFLLRQGQICKHFFYIERGLVRFYSIDDEGKQHIVQFAPETWFVGDRSGIYFNQPSDLFLDAIEETRVAMFDQTFIEFASDISPEYRNYNEHILQNHIRYMQNRINLLIGASATERYRDFIRLYPDLMLRVPQWMIASYLGITPESLSRVRRELAK